MNLTMSTPVPADFKPADGTPFVQDNSRGAEGGNGAGAGPSTDPYSQTQPSSGLDRDAHSTGSSGSGERVHTPLDQRSCSVSLAPAPTPTLPVYPTGVMPMFVSGAIGRHPSASGQAHSSLHSGLSFGRRHACKLCPTMFESKAELQMHTQVHMREAKPYKCSHCVKSFANSSYLSQHMRIHLGIKPFGPCNYCGRRFTQLSHLQQHLRTHTGEKPYKCKFPQCDKAFSQLSNLQSHSRCHQSDKPYKCNSCYKCFGDEQALLEHIPKHNETKHVKKCICPYCGKSYSQPSYLAKHMTKHADKKPTLRLDNEFATPWAPGAMTSMNSGSFCQLHSTIDNCNEMLGAGSPGSLATFSTASVAHSQAQHYANNIQSHHNMAAMAGAAGADSAFSRLTGLGTLSRVAAAGAGRTNYLAAAYDNFKGQTAGTTGLTHPGSTFPNQLIRLDDIQRYASMPSAVDQFQMLVGQTGGVRRPGVGTGESAAY